MDRSIVDFVDLQRLRQQRKGSLRFYGPTTWRSFLWRVCNSEILFYNREIFKTLNAECSSNKGFFTSLEQSMSSRVNKVLFSATKGSAWLRIAGGTQGFGVELK